MPLLVSPDVRYHSSWLEGSSEFCGAHRDGGGAEDWSLAELEDPPAFHRFVDVLIKDAIRHELNDFLLNEGGHIGYSIRPSARRRGYAAVALAEALPVGRDLGILRALVTCDEGNAGSRATIEKNGGIYEDTRHGKRRYWIDTK